MCTISVLISLYNKEKPEYLEQCLDSLVKQTRQPDEVVIVFDGPISKRLSSVVDTYISQLNINVVKLIENSGLAIALNLGLEVCEGEFIARLDTDDYCDPNRLEVQSDFLLKNKEIHILGSFANIVDENNKNSGIRKSPIYNNEIYEQLWCNPIIHPSVIFRKVDIMKIGGYDVNLRRRQDYELWFRAAKNKLKFHNIDTPLIYYRVDTDSHKKQNITLAFQQGLIGFKGTIRADLGLKNACICFYPFFRQLLPIKLQHHLYELLSIFDPRAK